MLSIGAAGSGQGTYYAGLTRGDYYQAGGEPPGLWLGTGAERLGLTRSPGGLIDREAFLRLFQGLAPDGTPLVQNPGAPRRQPAWDLTFSAPKSVSALWACADADTRRVIEQAHLAAVREACRYAEGEFAWSRRGKAGGGERDRAHLLIAAFEHGTSRAQDPQLHTHALVLNACVRPDGTTGAIESKPLYQAKMALGAYYRAELARNLEEGGVAVERDGRGNFAVRGVPESLVRFFSKRRTQVLAAAGEGAGAERLAGAALATRAVKEHVARQELFARWKEAGEAHGFTEERARALRSVGTGVVAPAPDQRFVLNGRAEENPASETARLREALGEAMEAALKRLTESQSHFTERELLRAFLEEAPGRGIWGSLARVAVRHAVEKSHDIVCLNQKEAGMSQEEEWWAAVGDTDGSAPNDKPLEQNSGRTGPDITRREAAPAEEKRYTTRALLEVEKGLLADVDALHHNLRPAVDEATLRAAVARVEAEASTGKERVRMNDEQRRALAHVTRGEGDIAAVSGMAGTGKTFLLRGAREAWQESGHRVVGAAVAARAARELEEGAGIDSVTLAALLWEPKQTDPPGALRQLWRAAFGKPDYGTGGVKLDDRTVVVVDEAGMVGTRDMAKLMAKVWAAGAKVVLVGDARQLQPVDVGGPFRSITQRIGAAELTTIVRQELDRNDKNPRWRRDAVIDFADGEAARALAAYHERGFLKVADDREAAMRTLIDVWKEKGAGKPNENLIFAGTRQETQGLNRMAQAAREEAGKLGFRRTRIGEETVREGDRVLITRNEYALGVSNGDLGTVKRLELITGRMLVKLDGGRTVSLPYRQFQYIELGYAVTTHKGQGATVKNAFVLCGGPMAGREMSYVQASRARRETHLFTERIQVWDPEKGERVDRTLEALARRMGRSGQKDLAHDAMGPSPAPAAAATAHAVRQETAEQKRAPHEQDSHNTPSAAPTSRSDGRDPRNGGAQEPQQGREHEPEQEKRQKRELIQSR